MDPRILYTDFLMDVREVLLQPMTDTEPTFQDDRGYTCSGVMTPISPGIRYLPTGIYKKRRI